MCFYIFLGDELLQSDASRFIDVGSLLQHCPGISYAAHLYDHRGDPVTLFLRIYPQPVDSHDLCLAPCILAWPEDSLEGLPHFIQSCASFVAQHHDLEAGLPDLLQQKCLVGFTGGGAACHGLIL